MLPCCLTLNRSCQNTSSTWVCCQLLLLIPNACRSRRRYGKQTREGGGQRSVQGAAQALHKEAARKRDALRVSGAVQPGAQHGASAAPARSGGRHGAARVWVPAERGHSVSGAAAAPVSGTPGRTASPAPPPLYARADAMWPRVEARVDLAAGMPQRAQVTRPSV